MERRRRSEDPGRQGEAARRAPAVAPALEPEEPLEAAVAREPRGAAAAGTAAVAVEPERPALPSSSPRKPLRILLVDDDPVFRELLAFVLRADVGAEIVDSAADGAKGVKLADELRPDLVVMDLLMRLMDGFEATKRIAATVPAARVLVVSSSTDPQDVERAGKTGAAG